MRLRRRLLPAIGVALLGHPVDAADPPQPPVTQQPVTARFVRRPEEDLLLLAIQMRPLLLNSTLAAYPNHGGVLVPLGEICELLELGIHTDVASRMADGFFLDERRVFHLDVSALRVVVEGKASTVDPGEVEVHQDDIYVDTRTLSKWLPLDFEIDLYGATLTIRPREPLPVQQREARALRSLRSLADSGAPRPNYPRLAVPYRFVDLPFVDQTLGLSLEPPAAERRRLRLLHSTYATGDLLAMGARLHLSGDQDGVSDSRLTLERRDPDGKLLGPLGARELAFGDVLDPGLDLVSQPLAGTGILVSNVPLQRPAEFDRQHFRGDLPPGWEVEIHRNGSILGYAQARADGLYEFLDVPLLFGLNLFRLMFFGPQGQRREETRVFNVGASLNPPGKVYYRLVANDPGRSLFDGNFSNEARRGMFDASIGLLRNVTGSVSLASVNLSDGRHEYGKLGMRSYWGSIFLSVDAVIDRRGGRAMQGAAQTRLGPFGLLLRHSQLSGFRSERFLPGSTPLRGRTEMRLDTAIPRGVLPRVGVVAEVSQETFGSGRTARRVSSTLSTYDGGYAVSSSLGWSSSSRPGAAASSELNGQLLASKFLHSFSVRGQLDYTLLSVREVTGLALTVEARPLRKYVVSVSANRRLRGGTRYALHLGRTEGAFGVGANLAHSQPGGLAAALFFSFGVARDRRTGDWHSTARSLAGGGAVSARVFLDENANGLWDTEEPLIPGAGFRVNLAANAAHTDTRGSAFLVGMPSYQSVGLSVAADTLEDVSWKPAVEGVSFVPRPGRVTVVDFPILVYGEVTGTVFVQTDGEQHEKGGIEVELAGREGEVVRIEKTAYDGFYDFTDVRPGRYEVRVSSAQATRLGLSRGQPREVQIAADGSVVDGLDLVLTRSPEPGREALVASLQAPGRTAETAGSPSGSRAEAPVLPTAEFVSFPTPQWSNRAPTFVIQIASYRRPENSERVALKLGAALGRSTHVLASEHGNLGVEYLVLVGDFETAEQATRFGCELKASTSMDSGPVYRLQSVP